MKYNSKPYSKHIYSIYDLLILSRNFFFKRYPINKKTDQLSCAPFFFISSGRCGNTLLRTVLCGHSKISIPPESFVLPKMVRKYQTLNFLEWDDLIKIVVGEIEELDRFYTWEINLSGVYQQLLDLDENERSLAKIIDIIYCHHAEQKFPGFKIWGDKTPSNTLNLGWIDRIFRNAKYIHIIRDGRDVVSSYLKMGRYTSVEEACWRWNKTIDLATAFGKSKSQSGFMEIRYEKFVTDTENEIRRVCEFLCLEFEKNMLNTLKVVKQLGDTHLPHFSNVQKEINRESIGKWRENLSEPQKEIVEKLLSPNLKRLGYA